MNQASTTVAGVSSGPCTNSVPSRPTTACHGEGGGTFRSNAANNGACAEGAAAPAGRSSWKSPSSGTQMSWHTSQFACAFTVVLPSAEGVTVTGSSTSPV